MAHLSLPPDTDPTTLDWLRLSRQRRRAAWADARTYMKSAAYIKSNGPLTKSQRRLATPWQGIVLEPVNAHLLSGHMTTDGIAQVRAGLNRRERRALKSKAARRAARSRRAFTNRPVTFGAGRRMMKALGGLFS